MSIRIINADVMDGLRQLPDESVNAVITSPPYWGLRDYGMPGQIGLENTPDEYVAHLVDVFRECRRVLHKDGTLWLNLGDTYHNADKWGGGGANTGKHMRAPNGDVASWQAVRRKWAKVDGLKPKDLIGIPWAVAFALRADGWWLRSANIWAKPNGMPESVRDRPTIGHEYVFQLSKSADYYYGYEDVRLPPAPESTSRLARAIRDGLANNGYVISSGGHAPPGQTPHQCARKTDKQRGHSRRHAGFNDRWDAMTVAEQQANGAALRSVWWISPAGFADAHFAVMPEELAALLVLAGCPKGGTVLDPFSGAGTTVLVADRLQRNGIGIEINPDYVAMSEHRIAADRGHLLDLMENAEASDLFEASRTGT